MGKRDPGNKPAVGSRVPYVYIQTRTKSKLQGDKIESPEYIKEHKVSVNEVDTLQHGVFKTLYDLSPTRKELKEVFKLVERPLQATHR